MSVLLDARPHATAVKDALDVPLGAWAAYDYDDVPGANDNHGKPPGIFVLISVERRFNPNVRMSAQAGTTAWRLAVRSVGRTVAECRWAQVRVAEVLNEGRLLVAGIYTSRLQYESGNAASFDDGRYSAVDIYTYVH